jgi:hypothetical protein
MVGELTDGIVPSVGISRGIPIDISLSHIFRSPPERLLNILDGCLRRESSFKKLVQARDNAVSCPPLGDDKHVSPFLAGEFLDILQARATGKKRGV